MRLIKVFVFPIFLFIIFNFFNVQTAIAVTSCVQTDCGQVSEIDIPDCLKTNIQCLQQKIGDAQSQAVTLKSTIGILSGQISVLQLQIDQSLFEISKLENEIEALGIKIEILNQDLDKLVDQLLVRVVELYKRRFVSPMAILFSFENLSAKASGLQYIKLTQQQVAKSMAQAEGQRVEFDTQKQLKQQKQKELEIIRIRLGGQRADLKAKQKIQEDLLAETNQNENEFQKQLDSAEQEFLAIQAICSGQSNEVEIGRVSTGQKIATLIKGESCNSDGTHLHFSVREKSFNPITDRDGFFCKNPFLYLKEDISYSNCSTKFGCGSPEGDPFVPRGSWDWPLNQQIYFYQGFGSTWAVKNVDWLPYSFHNGIDILGQGLDVKAVQPGTLFRGYYVGEGGCQLPYVVVRHDNTNLDSLYLHVNY